MGLIKFNLICGKLHVLIQLPSTYTITIHTVFVYCTVLYSNAGMNTALLVVCVQIGVFEIRNLTWCELLK